uniref:Cytochrome c oxidase subunit 3 n=1 Tax=Pelecinus polyturator TaxID=44352 RepID=A0A0E3EL49_9HYME|nr:cytochrome c oxidase subunit III [Pelecinus polyturator]AIW82471.1 cytochrome c oxidase subunit III [Pelecinus polyturator]
MMNHPFHLVTVSPWPLLTSLNLFNTLVSVIYWFQLNLINQMLTNFTIMIFCMIQWWRDVIRESTFQGFHTFNVYKLMKMGMILFIISEIMFFVSFFWTYFHLFLSPAMEIGMMWPPAMIKPFNPYSIPLTNTIILIFSGFTITWFHHSIINNKLTLKMLMLTILLGLIFMYFQYMEYNESFFSINDSSYGSIFYIITGFHGLHVFMGLIFLTTSLYRFTLKQFTFNHHFNLEAAIWYWHFVDIIWLFLYLLIYWWSF